MTAGEPQSQVKVIDGVRPTPVDLRDLGLPACARSPRVGPERSWQSFADRDLDEADAWICRVGASGDRGAFCAVFNLLAPKVKAYLLRHGVPEPESEDLVQETFLMVWRKADQFDPRRARAGSWIYAIARNLRVDLLRREHRVDPRIIDSQAEAQVTPEEALATVDTDARLRAAIEALPQDQAEVIRLAYFEARTHLDIAQRLGVPLGTVKSRIRLASARLRSALGEVHASRWDSGRTQETGRLS